MAAAREYYDRTGSTQTRALELARAGAAEGTRVVAGEQTLGRGRAGHAWESPPGGLYLSIVVGLREDPSPLLPLGIGAQLAEQLERRFQVAARLKWPNDLYVVGPDREPRKLAGILVDAVHARSRAVAVAGIGVNVRRPSAGYPREIQPAPVALDELTSPVPSVREVEDLAADAALAAARELSRSDGARSTVARCRGRLFGVGRTAWVDGRRVGTIASLEADGALKLEGPGGPMTIRAGDLRVGDP